MQDREVLFTDLLRDNQQRLFGYVFALLGNFADTQDVFQQTASVLWKKFDEFDPQTDFFRWAAVVARYEVLNFLRCRGRRRTYFSHEFMEDLEGDFSAIESDLEVARREALPNCLSKLSAQDQQLLKSRYSHGLKPRELSEILGRSSSSICNSLRRIHIALMNCIESSIATKEYRR